MKSHKNYDLNSLELRLISMRIPFMKMIALPRGQQRSIHGPAVNIPANLSSICDLLPRLPSESQLIPMKLKRKLKYKGHYMYEYICPAKPFTALRWLKSQSHIYANITINPNWEEQSEEDHLTLFSALMQQDCSGEDCEISVKLPSRDPKSNSSYEGSSKIAQTYQKLRCLASERGFVIKDVPADGDCLFSAISVQLESIGIQKVESRDLRSAVADYMEQNPMVTEELHYRNFISTAIGGDDYNFLNADTEAPTEEDSHISAI